MKITFVCPPFDSTGGQRVIATHADRLQRRGHHVVVVAPPRQRPTVRQIVHSLLWKRRWPSRPKFSHMSQLAVERRTLDKSRPVTDADVPDADVVVASWWETAEWVARLSPRKGAKVYFIQHHEVFGFLPVDRTRATYRLPLRKIVVAQWLADLAREEYGDPNAVVVPNAVDHELFHAKPRGKAANPTIGFMYSSVSFKGCDISLKALQLAAQRLPHLRVIVFGTSKPSPPLPLPASTEYHVAPPQDRIREIYSQCDAWLFASRSEGFGLPILEAMACRTPVIGTPAGAAPELLAGGGGYLVRPEDPQDMADAIARLCSLSDAEWRVLSDAAYATATQYNWDDATTLFEKALLTAAGKDDTRHAP